MPSRRRTVANWFGAASIVLSLVPAMYVTHAEVFPKLPLTEYVVLIGGVGGSLLAALIAGLVGSRWWLVALLGAALDVVLATAFSP